MFAEDAALAALSPLDGRYQSQLQDLANLFSEQSLIQHRVKVEVEYLLFLAKNDIIPHFSEAQQKQLQQIFSNFSLDDAKAIKALEQKTKHDVKAVEYFVRQQMEVQKIPNREYIHFALTSEDINAVVYSLLIKHAKEHIVVPDLKKILTRLIQLAETYKSVPMLARTHGQAAVPTTAGKELVVFAYRLYQELKILEHLPIEGKLTGAVGNFNAHHIAFPAVDWPKLSQQFLKSFDVQPNLFTTQVLPIESYSQIFSSIQRLNFILLDLNQDMWRYISDGYFIQKVEKNQVGSSTMPHKVNPINFENSEGNLGLANSLFSFFIQKLPISRLQRDLSDSPVKRSIGSAIGYACLGYRSLAKGLQNIELNSVKVAVDLNQHWEILTEAFQLILRSHGDDQGYEKLRLFSQGKQLSRDDISEFLSTVDIDPSVKKQLNQLSPSTYVGLAPELTQTAINEITHYLEEKHDKNSTT